MLLWFSITGRDHNVLLARVKDYYRKERKRLMLEQQNCIFYLPLLIQNNLLWHKLNTWLWINNHFFQPLHLHAHCGCMCIVWAHTDTDGTSIFPFSDYSIFSEKSPELGFSIDKSCLPWSGHKRDPLKWFGSGDCPFLFQILVRKAHWAQVTLPLGWGTLPGSFPQNFKHLFLRKCTH